LMLQTLILIELVLLFLISPVALLVSLIKPSLLNNLVSNLKPIDLSRKQWAGIFGGLFIASFVGIGVLAPDTPKKTETQQAVTSEAEKAKDTISPQTDQIASGIATPEPTPIPTTISTPEPTNREKVKVISVTDGDTIKVAGGKALRYIGIDTPETVSLSQPVGCYGKEASDKNKELVLNKEIEIEKDVSETDKYGRLLRYVYIDGVMVNEYLVREGYAQANSYPPDIKYQDRLREAQRLAMEEKKGLWGSVCDNWNTPAPTVKPVTYTPRPETNVLPVVPIVQQPSGGCKYPCSGPDRDCSDFSSHSEAVSFFSCCGFSAQNDPMKLDNVGVGDGIPCESLP